MFYCFYLFFFSFWFELNEKCFASVLSRSYSSTSTQEEPPRPAQQDGEQTLICWPPRASILNTGASRTGTFRRTVIWAWTLPHSTFLISHNFCAPAVQADSGAVDAVMKMWPPPAGPKNRDPEKDVAHRESSQSPLQPASSSSSIHEANQPLRSSRPTDQPVLQRVLSHPVQPKPAAVTSNAPPPPGYIQETNSCCQCLYWFKVT